MGAPSKGGLGGPGDEKRKKLENEEAATRETGKDGKQMPVGRGGGYEGKSKLPEKKGNPRAQVANA